MASANRDATQALLLTFGVKSDLMSPNLPSRHDFPNILLRNFYREVPLVEVGLLLEKGKSVFKNFYKHRNI